MVSFFVFVLDNESCDDDNEGEEPRSRNNSKPLRTRSQVNQFSSEIHKELKRITHVHSVRTFSSPSTIFGNTRSLYANDLHT